MPRIVTNRYFFYLCNTKKNVDFIEYLQVIYEDIPLISCLFWIFLVSSSGVIRYKD